MENVERVRRRDPAGVEAEGASPEFNRNLKVATKQMARKVGGGGEGIGKGQGLEG